MPKADDYRPLKIVEVETAPCQHHHSANYDPDKVVRGQPIQLLGEGKLKCTDCGEIFVPRLPPKRYTVEQLEQLAIQWRDENEATTDAQWIVSHLIAWLKKREREVGDA